MNRADGQHPGEQKQSRGSHFTGAERNLARRIADELGERELGQQGLIRRIVHELGTDLSLQLLLQAQEIEKRGGMLLPDGKTRRTPGGIFFRIVKDQAQHAHPNIYKLFASSGQKRTGPPPPPTPPKERPAPFTWPERLDIIAKLAKQGETGTMSTVVLKVIGRANHYEVKPGACTILRMTAAVIPSVPRGVPVPQSISTTYVMYVGTRLWNRIAKAADDPEDELIIEGFPQIDAETGTIALFAKRATSKKLEAARVRRPARSEQLLERE